MAGLLSESDILSFKSAIKDVTDTFMVTPLVYHHLNKNSGTIDKWSEDFKANAYVDYNLNGLLEYPNTEDNEVRESVGSFDYGDISVTFNLEDLADLGIINSDNLVIFTTETDYFTAKGILYRVKKIKYDGPINSRDVLVKIYGDISPEPLSS